MLKGLIIASLITLSGPVLAATPRETAKARATVIEARQQYNLGAFDLSLKAYQEAYKLTDDATLLFNIGQCQWKLGDDKAAVHSYRAYLRGSLKARNREMVEARIAELEKKLKGAEQGQRAPDEPAASPPPQTPPTIPATDGAGAAAAAVSPPSPEPAPAQPTPAAVPLPRWESAAAPPQAVLNTPGAAREERPAIYQRWWFWTALVAAVAGGVVVALMASSDGPSTPSCPQGASCGH